MEIAWIGTGIMGAPMARRLIGAGHHLRVFNRSPQRARVLGADGASVTVDAAEAARDAEVVFIMVPDTPDVESVAAKIEPPPRPCCSRRRADSTRRGCSKQSGRAPQVRGNSITSDPRSSLTITGPAFSSS